MPQKAVVVEAGQATACARVAISVSAEWPSAKCRAASPIDLSLPVNVFSNAASIVFGSVGKSSSGSPLSPRMRAGDTLRWRVR
jgi:hypothetical protein